MAVQQPKPSHYRNMLDWFRHTLSAENSLMSCGLTRLPWKNSKVVVYRRHFAQRRLAQRASFPQRSQQVVPTAVLNRELLTESACFLLFVNNRVPTRLIPNWISRGTVPRLGFSIDELRVAPDLGFDRPHSGKDNHQRSFCWASPILHYLKDPFSSIFQWDALLSYLHAQDRTDTIHSTKRNIYKSPQLLAPTSQFKL